MSKKELSEESKELIENPPCPVDIQTDKIDINKALKLRLENGLNYTEIAKHFNCSKQAVSQALKKYINPNVDSIAVAQNLNGVLKAKQAEMLCSLSTDTIKEMSGLQKITGFGILYDKTRLEEGKSTANVEYHSISTSLEELNSKINELETETY